MGVNLIGHGDASFNWQAWRYCLDIAVAFGWRPAGTIAPTDYGGEWNGTYCTNDLQEVTDDDARALGEALHRAVNALSTEQNLSEEQAKAWAGNSNRTGVYVVCKLADYAEKGGFEIM